MPKKPGRPASITKGQILATAMRLLRHDGETALSLRRLAAALDTAPTNIYNYFGNKAELLDALAEHALDVLSIDINNQLPWDQQLQRWMDSFRRAILASPELLPLVGMAGTAPSTLRKIEAIASVISSTGLDRKTSVEHAQGLLWTVMSFTFFESQASAPKVIKRLKATAAEGDAMLEHLALEDHERLWRSTVCRNIEGIRRQAETLNDH